MVELLSTQALLTIRTWIEPPQPQTSLVTPGCMCLVFTSVLFGMYQFYILNFVFFIAAFLNSIHFSWVCAYFCQLNPLIGPEIEAETLKTVIKEWGGRDV